MNLVANLMDLAFKDGTPSAKAVEKLLLRPDVMRYQAERAAKSQAIDARRASLKH